MLRLFQERPWIKETLIYAPIYFFLSLISLRTKIFFTPDWFNGILARQHLALLQFNYTNNEQSRLLQYLIPELFRQVVTPSVVDAYILPRWAFTLLGFICFHFYLRKWFSVAVSFAGVISQVRQMVPLSGIIIPMALYTLFQSERDLRPEASESKNFPQASNPAGG